MDSDRFDCFGNKVVVSRKCVMIVGQLGTRVLLMPLYSGNLIEGTIIDPQIKKSESETLWLSCRNWRVMFRNLFCIFLRDSLEVLFPSESWSDEFIASSQNPTLLLLSLFFVHYPLWKNRKSFSSAAFLYFQNLKNKVLHFSCFFPAFPFAVGASRVMGGTLHIFPGGCNWQVASKDKCFSVPSPPPPRSSCWAEAPPNSPYLQIPPTHSFFHDRAFIERRGTLDSLTCTFPSDFRNFQVGASFKCGCDLVRGSWVL